jgi:hypothetical protein
MKSEISNIKSQRAFMREYFYNFVEGTSNQICDYLISQGVKFRVTELKDKRKSVSGSLSKLYKVGKIKRRKSDITQPPKLQRCLLKD